MVPQTPFIFHGSLRENLDPFGAHSDTELAAALQHVQLWAPLCRIQQGSNAQHGGTSPGHVYVDIAPEALATPPDAFRPDAQSTRGVLDMELGEGSLGLSQGQQQLLCLARVLLKRPRLLCLDECTASVDPVTAATMHQVRTRKARSSAVV
jgi:ABC-type multidrug transport system fused ATPase/permease subunit